MNAGGPRQSTEKPASTEKDNFSVSAPAISLPKGGGAIRGIGEKFAANPVTGTGSMSVPIYTSPGRAGFGPQLALSYDSGAGNGPFGFGWSLSIPSITRKTDKGLPLYRDAEDSDVFLLSGAEDLVPELTNGKIVDAPRDGYQVRRYRPRIEGLFARIERWTKAAKPGEPEDTYWRSISRDNVTTIYGKTEESRIFDPADPTHIFSWLICETYDDKGHAIVYTYVAEDSEGFDQFVLHERNRSRRPNSRTAGRYLKRIQYGNRVSRLVAPAPDPIGAALPEWFFEVVFDYGEGHWEWIPTTPGNDKLVRASISPGSGPWPARPDVFSSHRAGFEVRTYRRCRRVLMFHNFPELGVAPYLVRSTDFEYADLDYEPAPTVESELAHKGSTRFASFLRRVMQRGYVWDGTVFPPGSNGSRYLTKALPPIDLDYSQAAIRDDIREVDAESLENLPVGLGAPYQWVDLDGEGLSGVLTEQAGAWFYKRNLSIQRAATGTDGPTADARFGPLERLQTLPSSPNLAGGQQLLDLAGDGQLDVVQFEGALPGYFERTTDFSWETFKPLESVPNIAFGDPNLKFVDLTGDGHADLLISDDGIFTWYPSLGEQGFGPAQRVHQHFDEEDGPHVMFADGTQSIYLADMSGDGLSDIVRIRNGEVCYWPNLGYGRFGAKITMDRSPWFDAPDLFDQRRIRMADIDGTGTNDIIYLRSDGVDLYFNRSGNSFSAPRKLTQFPRIDNLSSVTVVDLLGNGTACLVWSSPLAGDATRPMRYIDLMGGQKPHLLVSVKNNLGTQTTIDYAPSTKFYLADKLAGKPWVTRLPFPVHCVERVTVTDEWRKTKFATTYSYHHGYFDGVEREFRGFGRVEQVDVESFGKFAAGNAKSPYIADDLTLYQPPVKTVTWYHTGVFVEGERILSQYANEYFPVWFEALRSDETNVLGDFRENVLPEPDVAAAVPGLSPGEWREALRACKGTVLRQEIYELEIQPLHERGEQRRVKLFSTAYHNCNIQRLQPRGKNQHAVFLATESEAIAYHYELDLTTIDVRPDPRISHTLNLTTDQYGNVLQSVAIVYPRIGQHVDTSLPAGTEALIAQVQRDELHVAYTENRFTNDVKDADDHRLPLPSEIITYELSGINPEDEGDRDAAADPHDKLYFTIDELRKLALSDRPDYPGGPTSVGTLRYHERPQKPLAPATAAPEKRLVEHVRKLYFDTNLTDPLALGTLKALALPFETYKLALTEELMSAVFGSKLTLGVLDELAKPERSGYLAGPLLAARFGANAGQYWVRSGIAGFAPDASEHFYLPEEYRDAFGQKTTLAYDGHDLFITSSTDELQSTVSVEEFDWRILLPRVVKDINHNLSEVVFDALGMPTAVALEGKGTQADSLAGFDQALVHPPLEGVIEFFTGTYDVDEARRLLGSATARHLYHLGERREADGTLSWGHRPACAATILRERHVADLSLDPLTGALEESPLQTSFEYSDGGGEVLVKKSQAEPAPEGPNSGPLRWIASGKTVLNNKGKPVKQYEPYFSSNEHRFEELEQVGVTPVMYYDSAGRLVRTELPDGSYSRVVFSPWHVASYDANDTVGEPGNPWYMVHAAATASTEDQRAARLAKIHTGTPAVTFLDSLGRDVIAVTHNVARYPREATPSIDEKYVTFTKLDAEGKPLWIRDARRLRDANGNPRGGHRGNLVMQYIQPPMADGEPVDVTQDFVPCYDIAGNLLFQHSMDAGDRWILNDAMGKALFAWDFNERRVTGGAAEDEDRFAETRYDALHRPVELWLSTNGSAPELVEWFRYGEGVPDNRELSMRGQLHEHYDASGRARVVRCDFKAKPLELSKNLATEYDAPRIDWHAGSLTGGLETETFIQITEYDALGRMRRLYNWHRAGGRVAVYEPSYNARGLLESEDLVVGATKNSTAAGHDETGSKRTKVIDKIAYDAKGQRQAIRYGNGTRTRFKYDSETFRLVQLRTTRPEYDPDFPSATSLFKNDQVVQNLFYTYDPVGNVTEIYDDAYEPAFFSTNPAVEPQARYTYDALYRLIAATGREHFQANAAPSQFEAPPIAVTFPVGAQDPQRQRMYRQRYRYDEVGNILQMRHWAAQERWTRSYEYADFSNRLSRTWLTDDPLAATIHHHDTHGNMLNLANVANEFYLRWDHRDMLQVLNRGGAGFVYYQYDAGKQRSRKVSKNQVGDKEWERIYLGGMEIYRRYVGNGLVEETESHHVFEGEHRVLLVEDVLTTTKAGATIGALHRYQYGNHLGSACLELDATAKVITYEEYHPYGTSAYRTARKQTEAAKRYRHTGMERDEESGLTYAGARHSAAWFGRWLTADPTGLTDGGNLYCLVRDNPIRFSDVSGHQSDDQTRATETFIAAYTRLAPAAQRPLMSYAATADGRAYWKYHGKMGSLRVAVILDHIQKQPTVAAVFTESTSKVPRIAASGKVTYATAKDLGGPTTDPGELLKARRHDVVIKSKAAPSAGTTLEVSNFESFESQAKLNQMARTGESMTRKMFVGDAKRGVLTHTADIPQAAIVPKGGSPAPGWSDPATGLKIEPIAVEALPSGLFENTPAAPKSRGAILAREGANALKAGMKAAGPVLFYLQIQQHTTEVPVATSRGGAADYDADLMAWKLGFVETKPASVAYREREEAEQRAKEDAARAASAAEARKAHEQSLQGASMGRPN